MRSDENGTILGRLIKYPPIENVTGLIQTTHTNLLRKFNAKPISENQIAKNKVSKPKTPTKSSTKTADNSFSSTQDVFNNSSVIFSNTRYQSKASIFNSNKPNTKTNENKEEVFPKAPSNLKPFTPNMSTDASESIVFKKSSIEAPVLFGAQSSSKKFLNDPLFGQSKRVSNSSNQTVTPTAKVCI